MTTEAPRLTVVTAPTNPVWKVLRPIVSHGLLLIASFLMLYPLLWMLAASFRPEAEIFSNNSLIPSEVSLHGYISGWTGLSRTFDVFFLNSFIVSILCVVG